MNAIQGISPTSSFHLNRRQSGENHMEMRRGLKLRRLRAGHQCWLLDISSEQKPVQIPSCFWQSGEGENTGGVVGLEDFLL